MNKRYRELEKVAMTSRRTYEKILKKYNILLSQESELNEQLDKAKKHYKMVSEELEEDYTEEQYNSAQEILNKCRELLNYGSDFYDVTSDKIDKLREEANIHNATIEKVMKDSEPLIKECNELENNFKRRWEDDRKSISEEELQSVLKQHKELWDKRDMLGDKGMKAIFDRDKCIDKADKLTIKINKYVKLNDKKCEMVAEFCSKYGIVNEKDMIKFITDMLDSYKEKAYMLDRVAMYQGMISEHIQEMNSVKAKLSIAKYKMAEAEYQFNEYKHMIGAA